MAKNSEGEKTGGEGASSKAPEPPAAAPGGPSKPVGPPLVVAGRRLERLLGGGYAAAFSSSSSPPSVAAPASPAARASPAATLASAVEAVLHSNPPKIVRRWLGTSSGTATAATLSDVVQAAQTLLDPEGVAARGRSILEALSTEEEVGEGAAMDVDAGDDGTKEAGEGRGGKSAPAFLKAAAREVEAYLLSLAIRILLQKDASQAWSVSTESLSILTGHMDRAAKITALAGAAGALGGDSASGSKGLEPLLARLFRYRCLVAAKLVGGGKIQLDAEALRSELITAYRLACLRRDVDTQSTVLNLILQELLNADQSELLKPPVAFPHFIHSCASFSPCPCAYHPHTFSPARGPLYTKTLFVPPPFWQSSKHTSSFPTPPFPMQPLTTSSAAIFTTPAASRLFVSNTLLPSLTCRSVYVRPLPTPGWVFALLLSGSS